MSGDLRARATIRPTAIDDLPALKVVIDAVGLFPSELLDGMIAPFLAGNDPAERWLTAAIDGAPVAVAYYVPERMAQGTWNLLLIAVHPDFQGCGIGVTVMRHVESALAATGERILLVETSGLPAFAPTRAFYHRIGYTEEARIRDFYQNDDDKVVFRKTLLREPVDR